MADHYSSAAIKAVGDSGAANPVATLSQLRIRGWELVRADPPEAGPRTVTVGLHLTDEHGNSHTFHQYTVGVPDPKPQPTLADATVNELMEALRLRVTATPTPTIESEE